MAEPELTDSLKEEMTSELMNLLNVDDWTQLMMFLDYQESLNPNTPYYRTLYKAYRRDDNFVYFKSYAERLARNADKFLRASSQARAQVINLVNRMDAPVNIQHNHNSLPQEEREGHQNEDNFQFQQFNYPLRKHGTAGEFLHRFQGAVFGVGTGLARVWDKLSVETKANTIKAIKDMASNYTAISGIDECVTLVNKAGGTVTMVGLAAVYLSYNSLINLMRWWNGEISGRRFTKIFLDSVFEIGGGIGGGIAGAVLGTWICPGFGSLIGGILGGLAGGLGMKRLGDRLTTLIFDLPREEAAENSYKYLDVHHRASNYEVNRAFRAKALKHHPDKGGRAEDFMELQVHMSVIKMSRGERLAIK